MAVRAGDVREVRPTQDEIDAWHQKRCGATGQHRCRKHHPYRVECIYCETRMWLSGIGLGAHRRACPNRAGAPHGWEVKTFDGQRLVGKGRFDDRDIALQIARGHRAAGFTTRVRPAEAYGTGEPA